MTGEKLNYPATFVSQFIIPLRDAPTISAFSRPKVSRWLHFGTVIIFIINSFFFSF